MSVTTMQAYARQYIEERHRLGFAPSAVDRALRHFAAYVDDLGREGPLCIEVMATWACHPIHGSRDPKTWARRLKGLRPFTRWLRQFEPGTEVPDDSIFGSIDQRLTPHIYTEQEIADLVAAARQLQPPLRGATYATLFGLLACTGLRVSEALHLRNADVDLKVGVLRIRQTKFAKSRQTPIHPTTLAALRRYVLLRDRVVPGSEDTPLLVGSRGQRQGCELSRRQVDRIFQRLREQLSWVNRGAHATARVHDLRHSFVVARILRWQAQGVDIDQQMLALTTYVGHAHASETYWYLSAVPELMALASAQFEPLWTPVEVTHA
jgi:integrase